MKFFCCSVSAANVARICLNLCSFAMLTCVYKIKLAGISCHNLIRMICQLAVKVFQRIDIQWLNNITSSYLFINEESNQIEALWIGTALI
jgi:hypothetical protein